MDEPLFWGSLNLNIAIHNLLHQSVGEVRRKDGGKGVNKDREFSKLCMLPSLCQILSRLIIIVMCYSLSDIQSSVSTISRPPNLGVVVYMLRQCTNQFLHTYEAHKLSMRKLDSITALTPEELKEVNLSSFIICRKGKVIVKKGGGVTLLVHSSCMVLASL